MANTDMAGALLGVNAVSGLTQSFLGNTPNVSQTNKDISFADTLNQTTGNQPKTETVKETAATKTVVNKQSANVKEDMKNAKDVKSLDESNVKDVADSAVDKAEQIYDKAKEVLDVSDEDLTEAMEVLALTVTDLFDPVNIQNLVMEVTGTEDTVSLLTNVELYDQVKEITGFAEEMLTELSEETGIDVPQLKEFIQNNVDFKNVLENAVAENTEIEAETVNPVKDDEDTEVQVNDTADNSVKVEVVKTEAVKPEKVETSEEVKDIPDSNKPAEVQSQEVIKEPVKAETSGQKANSGKHNDHMSQNNETVFTQPVNAQPVNTTVENIVNTIESYTNEQAQEIFRQITDFVKVNITAESTNMEMQLHPASLGTVNMQINSTNGQITAHLTVQNELVKAVLESQLVQLQETFNEQGTKVEAIEVTVANYNLDSAMNNNTDNNNGESSSNRSGSRSRNINLNVEGAFDDLTDEEKLIAEVMDMNGNSVNFTA